MLSKLTGVGVVAALLLAACGGSGKTKTSTNTHTKTNTKTTHSSTSKTPPPPKAAPLAQVVLVAGSHAKPSNSARAKTGDGVEFLTKVPGTTTSPPVKVHLDFAQLAPTKWTVTASAKGQKSTATLTSKDGKPLVFSGLHYGCALPPSATFCPVSHTLAKSGHIKAQFTATPSTPIAIATKIGPPPNTLASTTPSSSLVAPTYAVLTTLVAVPAHKSKTTPAARLSTTASVHPGDHVLMRVRVTGKVVGAPQPLTFTFGQGPAQSITVTAGVPGGTPSTGTITSATGKKIAIVVPRFGCLLPPSPTFCPPAKVTAASHKYTVTLKVTPQTPPIAIQAVAQGG